MIVFVPIVLYQSIVYWSNGRWQNLRLDFKQSSKQYRYLKVMFINFWANPNFAKIDRLLLFSKAKNLSFYALKTLSKDTLLFIIVLPLAISKKSFLNVLRMVDIIGIYLTLPRLAPWFKASERACFIQLSTLTAFSLRKSRVLPHPLS